MPTQPDGSADNPQATVSLQYLLENYCDPTDWEIVVEGYRKLEIESREWQTRFITDILAKYPNGITTCSELRADHRYTLIAYLDDELQKAAFYRANPEDVHPLFVEVIGFCGIRLTEVAQERTEAAKHIANGPW